MCIEKKIFFPISVECNNLQNYTPMKKRIINAIMGAIAIYTTIIFWARTRGFSEPGHPKFRPESWEEIYRHIHLDIFMSIIAGMIFSYLVGEDEDSKKNKK